MSLETSDTSTTTSVPIDKVIKTTTKDDSVTLTKEQTSALEQDALSEGISRAEELKKNDK